MVCRKHSPGNPCCVECCGVLTAPTGWVGATNCCYECLKTITEGWTNECSLPIREDDRSASVNIQIYRRATDTVQGMVSCVETPPGSGIMVCTVGGAAFPACRTPYLCGTVSISNAENKKLKLVARWRAISQGTTISRVMVKCGADAVPTCKWVVVSRRCLQIEWGTVWFSTSHLIRSDNDPCCEVVEINSAVTAATCESVTPTVYSQNSSVVCIKRSKFYNTEPTGVITFSPGDSLSTCDLTGVTICDPNVTGTLDDDDVVVITGPTTSTAVAWTAPTCTQSSTTQFCSYGFLNDFNVCQAYQVFDEGQTITILIAVLSGSLLSGQQSYIVFNAACDGTNYCTNWTELSETRCVGLTSSRTDSGHVNRTITFNYPSWTADLGNCA